MRPPLSLERLGREEDSAIELARDDNTPLREHDNSVLPLPA
jgi:hypothetical protein